MHSDERSGHVPEANLENQASNELTLLVQTERGVAIDNESLHEAGFQESLDSSQLLSPRTEKDNLPIVEVRKVNGESDLVRSKRPDRPHRKTCPCSRKRRPLA